MSKIDFQHLAEHFQITSKPRQNVLLSFRADELLDYKNMELLVQTYAPLIKAQDESPVGTYFCSWLGPIRSWTSIYDLRLELFVGHGVGELDSGVVCRW